LNPFGGVASIGGGLIGGGIGYLSNGSFGQGYIMGILSVALLEAVLPTSPGRAF